MRSPQNLSPFRNASQNTNRSTNLICACAGAYRYVILIIGLLFFTSLLSSLLCYSAVFGAMVDKTTSPLYNQSILNDNRSIIIIDWYLPLADQRFSYGFVEKMLSIGGSYVCAMIGVFPMGLLLRQLGAHKLMTLFGVLSTLLAASAPILASCSFSMFVLNRTIAGLAFTLLFPVSGIIANEWAPVHEKSIFLVVLGAHLEFSPVITMPLSGFIASNVSWPAVFYIHALMCGVMTLLWALCYRDKVVDHPFVGNEEYRKIGLGKSPLTKKVKTPVSRIISTPSLWGIWAAVFGYYLAVQFSVAFSPMYMNNVLGYSISSLGYICTIPLAILLIIKYITMHVSDRIACISEIGKLRLFNSIALFGSGIFFILLSCAKPGDHIGDVVLIVIPISLLGFSSGGFPKAVVMVAKQYSPFVMSIVQLLACLTLVLGSILVPLLTPEDTFDAWKNVFIMYGTVLVISNFIFIALIKAEPASWTRETKFSTVVPTVHLVKSKRFC